MKGANKVQLQNLIYNYFVESTRHFKRLQSCVKSGQAELLAVLDGDEPCATGLEEANLEVTQALSNFREGTKINRIDVGGKLHGQKPWYPAWSNVIIPASVISLMGTAAVWGTSPAPAMVAVSAAVGAGAGIYGSCPEEEAGAWERLQGQLEETWRACTTDEDRIAELIHKRFVALHNLPVDEALSQTEMVLQQLNILLSKLREKGLTFDP